MIDVGMAVVSCIIVSAVMSYGLVLIHGWHMRRTISTMNKICNTYIKKLEATIDYVESYKKEIEKIWDI